ncbi:MAG: ion channel [Bacteroidia bacterium]|jgi:inward rectifier potassium channel
MQNKTESKEIGFGSKTSQQRKRLINNDGSFNVHRTGQSMWNSTSIYHALITMKWLKFYTCITAYFILVNLVFTFFYCLAGIEGLRGVEGATTMDKFLEAFFFSTQTISTVGFGRLSPGSHLVSTIAALESLLGLLGFAVVTGLIYGRFSRPKARILFSEKALIAPFKNGTAFQFRIANRMRNSQMSDIEARVTVAKFEMENGVPIRRFRPLELEIKKIIFFPMAWTVNHPINENSPLYGMTQEDIKKSEAEFMILLNGFDDTFSQNVTARFSYTSDELIAGAKFVSIFGENKDGEITQDLSKISDYEVVK